MGKIKDKFNENPFLPIFFIWLISLLVWYLDITVFRFNGINFNIFVIAGLWIKIIRGMGIVLAVAGFFFSPVFLRNKKEWVAILCLVWLITLICCVGINFGALLHLIMALLFFFVFYATEEKDKVSLIWLVFILISLDFVGYGILEAILNLDPSVFSRVIFPVWPIFISWYGYIKTQDSRFTFIWILMAIFYVFVFVDGQLVVAKGNNSYLDSATIRAGLGTLWTAVQNMIMFPFNAFNAAFQQSILNATGDYYSGNQEQSGYSTQLGVYFEDTETDMERYFTGDSVSVWSKLRAKTLETDDPINIELTCVAIDEAGEKISADRIEPGPNIDIYSEEDLFITCDFSNLEEGFYEIQMKAEFLFETTARLKTFFMNKETARALKREDKDIYQEYPVIEDSVAIYTEGPVAIGMETIKQPILVDESGARPYIGITIENQWEGVISRIDDFSITVPQGMELDTELDSCDFSGSSPEYHHNNLDEIGAIDFYRSFKCRFIVDLNNDLDDIPVTTRYFRTKVNYYYSLTEVLDIEIEPEEEI
ncbi:hypothetical protein JXB41_01340 [Candidatus Woesearchaeota archaeon]|nr:hypothetical protein [Candidatus Woesearchaeota archaeon]